MGEPSTADCIARDWSECERNPVAGVSLTRVSYNKWLVTVTGPTGTPYETGVFRGEITVPVDYPTSVFQFKLLTKLYSPVSGFTAGSVTINGGSHASVIGFLQTLHKRLFVVDPMDSKSGDDEAVRRQLQVGLGVATARCGMFCFGMCSVFDPSRWRASEYARTDQLEARGEYAVVCCNGSWCVRLVVSVVAGRSRGVCEDGSGVDVGVRSE